MPIARNKIETIFSVFGGNFKSHFLTLENVRKGRLTKVSKNEEEDCFVDVEAHIESYQENFDLDVSNNLRIEKPGPEGSLCKLTEVIN